jgi:hypothetical protein
MAHGRVNKKSMERKSQDRRKMGRLKLRCLRDVENDLQELKKNKWR